MKTDQQQNTTEKNILEENLKKIKNKIVILSGKGGVGKSTIAVNLAAELANNGYKTGILDVDIHGPSVPQMFGINNAKLAVFENGNLIPININDNLKVISIGFLLENIDDAIIWRGPKKNAAIKQFLENVEWGELDYLIIDSPPGTGDEPLAVCQMITDLAGAVIVTTPQDVAILDVKKSITFCKAVNVNVIGVVENMSGFTCPHCNKSIDIFQTGGGFKMAKEMDVPFLGSVPIDSEIVTMADKGLPYITEAQKGISHNVFKEVVNKITQ